MKTSLKLSLGKLIFVPFEHCPNCGIKNRNNLNCEHLGYTTNQKTRMIIHMNYCCHCENDIDSEYELCKECKEA